LCLDSKGGCFVFFVVRSKHGVKVICGRGFSLRREAGLLMSRKCALTGRGPHVGHNVSHAHNVSLRRWDINLQKVRVLIDGRPVRIRVSTRAIKSGLIVRPPFVIKQRKPKEIRPVVVSKTAIIQDEEPVASFFSDSSIIGRIFKPKPKTEPTGPVPGVDIPAFDAPEPTYGAELDGSRRNDGNQRQGGKGNSRDKDKRSRR